MMSGNDSWKSKYETLLGLLAEGGPLAVAFSGGVDSALLLCAAEEALGGRVLALTAASCFTPERELAEAEAFCRERGIRQIICRARPLEIPGVKENPANRCYLCKKELFTMFLREAAGQGFDRLAEGSNLDDEGDYRPGMQAVAELGIESPLRAARFTKADIRAAARAMGLPVWNKPSLACLASRFAYGDELSEEKLRRVELAEEFLRNRGFSQLRVRVHGDLARIEVPREETGRLLEGTAADDISRYLGDLGFTYVTADLRGYRTGAMNEALGNKKEIRG